MAISIRNLYFMFCYAWKRFPAGASVDVSTDHCPDLVSLFAKILVHDANRLLRQGLERNYMQFERSTRAPRGKMMMQAIVKEQTLRRGELVCEFDELTDDNIHNQILKATAQKLGRFGGIERSLSTELGLIVRRMDGVSDVPLSTSLFRKVQLHRNAQRYRPVLNLCEFVARHALPAENGNGSRFPDILHDEVTMSSVFEEFLRNFYSHEQDEFTVRRETLHWHGASAVPDDWAFVPEMNTDITMRSRSGTKIIDAKYYAKPFSDRYGNPKIHSDNLYQLLTYLRHERRRSGDAAVSGALVYPGTEFVGRRRYCLDDFDVDVAVVDFSKDWQSIHEELLAVIR